MNLIGFVASLTILGLAFLSRPVRAEDHGAPAKSHDEGHGAAPTKDKAKGKDKNKSKTEKGGEHGGIAVPLPATRSGHYVHHWLSFPEIHGRDLISGEKFLYQPKPGRAIVVVFLASWCLPCQQMVPSLKEMEKKFSDRYTDFLYVFAHDTEPDAKGFVQQYKLGQNVVLGSAALLETFHQPELPTVYVGDRFNWMVMRKVNTKIADLEEIAGFLDLHTAL